MENKAILWVNKNTFPKDAMDSIIKSLNDLNISYEFHNLKEIKTDFIVRAYHFNDLAQEYFPDAKSKESAYQQFKRLIDAIPNNQKSFRDQSKTAPKTCKFRLQCLSKNT